MTSFIPDDRRAIVLGASIAGLLTARVLCGRFAEVVLLERD
jgi:flavin-dependent dehydrogenase